MSIYCQQSSQHKKLQTHFGVQSCRLCTFCAQTIVYTSVCIVLCCYLVIICSSNLVHVHIFMHIIIVHK